MLPGVDLRSDRHRADVHDIVFRGQADDLEPLRMLHNI